MKDFFSLAQRSQKISNPLVETCWSAWGTFSYALPNGSYVDLLVLVLEDGIGVHL